MFVACRSPVRACQLKREENGGGCCVAAESLDQRELEVVMDDVRFVHGVCAIAISEVVTAPPLPTRSSGEPASTDSHEAFAGLHPLLDSLLHSLLIPPEALQSLLAAGGRRWGPNLQSAQTLMRCLDGVFRERLDELEEFITRGHARIMPSAKRPTLCHRAPSNVGHSPVGTIL